MLKIYQRVLLYFKIKESFIREKRGILHILSCTCISASFDALTFSIRNFFDAFQQLNCIIPYKG